MPRPEKGEDMLPRMAIDQFGRLTEKKLKDGPSVEIVNEAGEYLATLIVPQTGFVKERAHDLAEASNEYRPRKA